MKTSKKSRRRLHEVVATESSALFKKKNVLVFYRCSMHEIMTRDT